MRQKGFPRVKRQTCRGMQKIFCPYHLCHLQDDSSLISLKLSTWLSQLEIALKKKERKMEGQMNLLKEQIKVCESNTTTNVSRESRESVANYKRSEPAVQNPIAADGIVCGGVTPSCRPR